ncbi:MAG: hypothetical protein KGJ35_02505 [Patescibacteria group bacterium]|nr:hypothetical protein [Patescibacteria group bacterium]
MKTIIDNYGRVSADGRYLRPGEFVPAAAGIRRVLSQQDLLSENLPRLCSMRDAIIEQRNRLLPLEKDIHQALTAKLDVLQREIGRYEFYPIYDLPFLDPSFLSWKTTDGCFPAFTIFSLEHPSTIISLNRFAEANQRPGNTKPTRLVLEQPEIPEFMARHYLNNNLEASLIAYCDEKNFESLRLIAHYEGVMPDEVREKIRGYLNPSLGEPRFDQIFIIADAPDETWQVKGIPQKDPLVVGVSKKTPDTLWLIAAYDLTPAEKFARDLCLNAGRLHVNN